MRVTRALDFVALVSCLVVLATGSAWAQSWKTTTQLVADNANSSCNKSVIYYDFTVAGTELLVKTPAGQTQRGPIGPDGTVTIVWKAPFASVGTVTISGNAQSRDLGINFSGQGECKYRLVPVTQAATAGSDHWAAGPWGGVGMVQSIHGGAPSVFQVLLIISVSGGRPTCTWMTLTPKCELKDDHILIEKVGEKELELRNIDLVRNGATALNGTGRTPDLNMRVTFSLKR